MASSLRSSQGAEESRPLLNSYVFNHRGKGDTFVLVNRTINNNTRRFFARFPILFLFAVSLLAFVWSSSVPAEAATRRSEDKRPPFVATLQPKLTALMKQLKIPGAIVSINLPGQGAWTTAMGTSNLATDAPLNSESHMRIGSITKTFTATIILRLVEEGRLRLDDPISKYQPNVPNGAHITIRELLNMTSGLFNYSEDSTFIQSLIANPERVWSPSELLAIAFSHQPYFAPGQGWYYANTNYIVLGLLVEQITGMPIEKVFEQDIFRPLGMFNTSFPRPTSAALPDPHPHGYIFASSGATAPLDVTYWNPSWAWAAGATISTLHDLKIWARALATGQLLRPTTQKERLSWIDIGTWVGKEVRYGLGIADFGCVIGHNGSIPGFQSFMGYVPEKAATIIVLTNLSTAPDGSAPADDLEQVIQQELFA